MPQDGRVRTLLAPFPMYFSSSVPSTSLWKQNRGSSGWVRTLGPPVEASHLTDPGERSAPTHTVSGGGQNAESDFTPGYESVPRLTRLELSTHSNSSFPS